MRLTSVLLALATLIAPGLANAQTPTPVNTISCDGFEKLADGSWRAAPDVKPFDFGTQKGVSVRNTDISPRYMSVGGADLYALIEAKCGKPK